ncbi:fatty acid desaturase-domain-containing protein [Cantharellus anzutake]|uniref:fatty acid desaturase-domain-containing protein n=1 Tax=Cantharellus anzutake TaxID=1750568 RepID=UPI00190450EE|nr:fatty acid desaturase-domain-containing protein [Cantharellus anzutake]KAF8324724.1 fatty acid desaturase-domain-containing protein [Cantharellus anzutake]
MSIFEDGPEYKKRLETEYALPKVTLKDIHAAIPKHLWKKSILKGIAWTLRDVALCTAFYQAAKFIDPIAESLSAQNYNAALVFTIKWGLWSTYWWFQGLTGGALFCIGHDAGHGTLSDYQIANHTIGFIVHTFILTPYWSWRHSHHLHHKSTGSMERDENYVPKTRSELKMADEKTMKRKDYAEIFEETPLWTLTRMVIMQTIGWNLYLTYNTLGSPSDRVPIIFTNVLLATWASFLALWTYNTSVSTFVKYYFIPYIWTNHWIVMFTYLHHTDPTMPHFRRDTWTFLRGAATTIDRPLMGWQGRFFLHNISHDHVAHHFFSSIPFWNGPELTKHVRKALGDDYNSDSTNTWRALYRSFVNCEFVEDEGDIIMWKNRQGEQLRRVAADPTGASDE